MKAKNLALFALALCLAISLASAQEYYNFDNRIAVSDNLQITLPESDTSTSINVTLSNGQSMRLEQFPVDIVEHVTAQTNTTCPEENCTIEMEESERGNETIVVYEVTSVKEVKLFGFINAEMEIETEVDASTGEILSVNRPWWAFLSSNASITGNVVSTSILPLVSADSSSKINARTQPLTANLTINSSSLFNRTLDIYTGSSKASRKSGGGGSSGSSSNGNNEQSSNPPAETNQTANSTGANSTSNDTVAPFVVDTEPFNMSIYGIYGQNVSARFSEAMDPLTLNETTFLFFKGEEQIPGVITVVNDTATFDPTIECECNTTYSAIIKADVTDLAGNRMGADYTWSFTTADQNASNNPENNETNQTAPGNETNDTTPPVTANNSPNGWQNQAMLVTLTPADDVAVASTFYCVDSTNTCEPTTEGTSALIEDDGINFLRYYSVDTSGNAEDVKSTEVKIDKTAPRLLWALNFEIPSNVTFTSTNESGRIVEFHVSGHDDIGGGNIPTECEPASGSFFEVGTTRVDCTAQDFAGNTNSTSFDVIVNYDPDGEEDFFLIL